MGNKLTGTYVKLFMTIDKLPVPVGGAMAGGCRRDLKYPGGRLPPLHLEKTLSVCSALLLLEAE